MPSPRLPAFTPRTGPQWPVTFARWVLILMSPVLLLAAVMLLVNTPLDVARGIASIASGHDVVQLAGAWDTGIVLTLLFAAIAALWLFYGPPLARVPLWLMLSGWLLWLPAITLASFGVEYALGAVLSARGYAYCTFHTTETDRGGTGTYVYVRTAVPGGCDAVKAVFPPGRKIPGQRAPFDLPRQP